MTIVIVTTGVVMLFSLTDVDYPLDQAIFSAVFAAFATVGAVVATRIPSNRVGWLFLAAGALGSLEMGTATYATLAWEARLPGGVLAAVVEQLVFFPSVILLVAPMLFFPNGRLPSPRWRWVVGVMLVAGVTLGAGSAMTPGELNVFPAPNPLGVEILNPESPGMRIIGAVGFGLFLMTVVGTAASMVVRFRRSQGVERQQLKWFAYAAGLAGAGLVVVFVVATIPEELEITVPEWTDSLRLLPLLGLLALPIAAGLAILRYRLYDIDVVISRTFVYGTLAVFIGGVYIATVVGLGRLLGAGEEPNAVLGVAATALIAIAFQPLRRRLERFANRLVYGRKATPYEVLSSFSQRVTAVDPDVLTQIARSLVEGTTAGSVSIWMSRGPMMQLIATWPIEPAARNTLPPDQIPADHHEPVIHDGERLGLVAIRLSPGQPFSPLDARLLEQVSSGLGLALRNLRLTEDLRSRVIQLRESRRRIVALQDMTRRNLERDLHDGAQQRLVALKIKLGIGVSMAEKAGLSDVEEALATLRAETDATIDSVRNFARGLYPPLLEAEGLGPALTAQTRNLSPPVTVQAGGIGRYSREVESTVYFCVLEAVHNAVTHSKAASLVVTLDDRDSRLRFEVRDDGVGFDPSIAEGSGLTNMADRLDSLEGFLEVASTPGRGTVVSGYLPTGELVKT
jgi:signal transduction histidine kinase